MQRLCDWVKGRSIIVSYIYIRTLNLSNQRLNMRAWLFETEPGTSQLTCSITSMRYDRMFQQVENNQRNTTTRKYIIFNLPLSGWHIWPTTSRLFNPAKCIIFFLSHPPTLSLSLPLSLSLSSLPPLSLSLSHFLRHFHAVPIQYSASESIT